MKKLLIVDTSQPFVDALISALHTTHEIRHCADNETALSLLQSFHPDKMVLSAELQDANCLPLLQYAPYLPRILLVTTSLNDPFFLQSLQDFGISAVMQIPCNLDAVVGYLCSEEYIIRLPGLREDPQRIVCNHLRQLAISEKRDGFMQLSLSIPLFAEDRRQSLTKEVFPRVAQICGNNNWQQVESSVRKAIQTAWLNRNAAVWEAYFPGCKKAPTSKQFISVLSGLIDTMYPSTVRAQNE